VKDLGDLLAATLQTLATHNVQAALVGGLAVSVRTEPRFTRDIDLAVAVASDAEAEALVSELAARGWRVTAILEQESANRLAAARLQPPGEGPAGRIVDLLFASSGIEHELVEAAEEMEVLPGIIARVARTGHLIALKLLARADDRPQDSVDVGLLLKRAVQSDVATARAAAQLIVERGYHRGRDLVTELDRLVGGRDGT